MTNNQKGCGTIQGIFPIDAVLPELKRAVQNHSAVVLHAPPGAGKTTRAPFALLDILPAGEGSIIMLEPRRLAATSSARWMAKMIKEEVGETVGYSIRFDRKKSEKTRIEVVTEGILTRRIQDDPGLQGVSLVIFDEFHERSIHADLALSLCLDIRKSLRSDLKLLIMSATLDIKAVAELLGDAAIISSEGRTYPVEERYAVDRDERPVTAWTADAVVRVINETDGDILVFLPGYKEIRQTADKLSELLKGKKALSVHALYGDLPFDQQQLAIMPSEMRKIVLATNIAETSLTIEGVKVVIDSGLTRRLLYDPSTGMNRLTTMTESRASAIQRQGRAGRLGPGVCYRLYPKHIFDAMLPYTRPEILESELSSLVLELAVWGVKEPSALSWLDAPPSDSWNSGVRLLKDLGALDSSGSATVLGRAINRLPLHPRLGIILQRAAEAGDAGSGTDLAAILSERDMVRGNSRDSISDITERLDMLRAWRAGESVARDIDIWTLKTIDRTSSRLRRMVYKETDGSGYNDPEPELVPRLLLSAFPDRIAMNRKEDGRFLLCNGRGIRVPATSRLAKSPCIIAVNLDAGERTEGFVHMAEPVSEEMIRNECSDRIRNVRTVKWDRRLKRIISSVEERLDSLVLSSRQLSPSDEEVIPVIAEAIKTQEARLVFSGEARTLQARIALMKRTFSEEIWPDVSDEHLIADPEKCLLPWLSGARTAEEIAKLDLQAALWAGLSWKQQKLLGGLAPTHIKVPSGSRIAIDYTAGEMPVLPVKLQEMFGLADTPVIAGGRIRLLLHLLSPARRPVQITQDLKGFWDSGYQQVKKELKGRYPKHPWPDDPWNALPTRRTKPRK